MSTEPVSVVIEGENFLPLATQHIGGGEPVTMDARFEAFLGGVALEDVAWVDGRTLEARIPEGLAPGWHSLVVVGPLGGRTELPRAYLSSEVPLATLRARASLEREKLSVEQRTRLLLTVENTGTSAALAVTPVLRPGSEGRVEVLSEPGSADIAAGGSASFAWELGAVAPGELLFTLEIRAIEELTEGALRALAVEVGPLWIRHRAVLTASFLPVVQQVVNEGQAVTVSLRVTNTGETDVLGVVPGAPMVLGSQAALVSGPEPARADLPAGESRDFEWTYTAGRVGPLAFQVDAQGLDAHSGVEVWSPTARSADITVQLPGALVARFSPLPASVNLGQEFDAELEVTNPGDSAVLGVVLDAPSSSGTGLVTLVPGSQPEPASVDLPGKGRAVFRARLVGAGTGSCVLQAGARGVDQTDGTTVMAARIASSTVNVQRPSELTATFLAPIRVRAGKTFSVSLKVTNTGSTAALGVTPSLPESSSQVAELLGGPDSPGADLAGGASATFTWNYRAARIGKTSFSAVVGGRDGNTGSAVITGRISSGEVSIVPEAEQLLADALGDGSPFAQVLGYDGRVYLGPNKSGTGGVTVDLGGQGPGSFGFFLHKDTWSNFSQNTSAAPYPSIGATGCGVNTSECGPDNEDGRGFFFSGRVGTQEWLGIGGARSGGDLDYVYLGQDTADLGTMYLRYLDLSSVLGGQTRGFSTALFFGDRLYLGFPDTGGSRPYLVVVKRLPIADPGYDTASGMDVEDLRADGMPGIGAGGSPKNVAPIQMIDTLAGFNDRLYVANNGGCMRSTMPMPRSYSSFPGDWASCTPSLPAWASRTSQTTDKAADLEPADRAVPQLAVFQGRLYLARNTTSAAGVRGPQLFVCSPEGSGSPVDCDPGDWSLVAPNSTGDVLLTQFNDPDNVSISLLVATANALHVGFENASRGVVLLRAYTATPVNRGDFMGAAGCSAAQFPAGCEGLAGNGLGVGATRIFDGKVLGASGSESVYLTAGNGTGPVGLFCLMD